MLSVLDSIEKEYLDVEKTEGNEFLGEKQSPKKVSYDAVLEDADQMLPELRSRLVERQYELILLQRNMSAAATSEEKQEVPGQVQASKREKLSVLCNATQFPAVMTGEGAATIDGPNDPLATLYNQSPSLPRQTSNLLSY